MEIKIKDFKKILKTIGKVEGSGKLVFCFYDNNNFDVVNSDLEKVIKYKVRNEDNFDDLNNERIVFEVDSCISGIIDKLSGDDSLQIELKDNLLSIKKDRMNSNISIKRDIVYNDIDDEEKSFVFGLRRDIIKKSMEKTITAVTKTDKIPETMKCLCFKVKDNVGVMVGTDMSRLYTYNFILDNNTFATDSDVQYIIPAKNILEIMRVCDLVDDEMCELYDCNGMLLFKFKNIDICVNVFSEEYKDYNRVLNYVTGEREVTVDGKKLKSMLSPIIAFASSQIFATTIKMLFNPTEIIISSISDRGNIEDVIECLGNAENREVAFNGNILFDIINHLSDDNIKFIFDDEISKPIKVVNNEGSIVDIIIPLQSRAGG